MEDSWTVPDLLQLSGGYWSACAVHAGVKLGIFTALPAAGADAKEMAGTLNLDPRGLGMLLDSLAAMKLLVKDGAVYSPTTFSSRYLSKESGEYLGHIILHHHHLMSGWTRLDESVRSGGPVRERVSHVDDEIARESFLMGMFNLAMQLAPRVASAVDLAGRRRLLDFGGGPGTYAIHFCLANPDLSAVIFDLPSTRNFAERTVARFDVSERVSFAEGDFTAGPPAGKFDVAWLSHVLHGEGPEGCARLLRNAVASLQPGGVLLVQEFILNDPKDGPLFPALFSLNMLIGTPHGQAYSRSEIFTMLAEAGLVEMRLLDVDLPNGAGIIAGTVPVP